MAGITKQSLPLWSKILIGLVIGAIHGFLWQRFGSALLPIGTAFIKLIKMIVIPLVKWGFPIKWCLSFCRSDTALTSTDQRFIKRLRSAF